MKTIKSVETDVDSIILGYFDPEKEEFVELTEGTPTEMWRHVVEHLHDQIVECIGGDLKAIWERLDKIENL